MNTAKSAPKIATFGLAALILAPIAIGAASATTDNGSFTVRAQNVETPTIVGEAGMKLTSSNTDPGGNPGNEESSKVVFKYECGPMSWEITEEMLDRSQRNWNAKESGNSAGIVPDDDGWVFLTTTNESWEEIPVEASDRQPDYITAVPAAGGSTKPKLHARVIASNNQCAIQDRTDLSLSGKFISYAISDTGAGLTLQGDKVVSIGGESFVQGHSFGTFGANTEEIWTTPVADALLDFPARNRTDVMEHMKANRATGATEYQVAFGTTGQKLTIMKNADGSTTESYGTGNGNRPNGAPINAKWDSTGTFVGYGAKGATNYTSSTLEQWNQRNGSSWDGKMTDLNSLKGSKLEFEHTKQWENWFRG